MLLGLLIRNTGECTIREAMKSAKKDQADNDGLLPV